MQVDFQHLGLMMEMQQLDLKIMQAKKQRVELPQRIKAMMVRKKRDEIKGKLDQVMELYGKAIAEKTVIEDEDRALAEKQARAQEIIDASGTDYRRVESHSKEMAGAAKRRDTLAEQMLEVDARIDKIVGVRSQLEAAIESSEAEEARLRAAFEAQDDELVDEIRKCVARRVEIESQIPVDLMDLYTKTAAKTGGVALGRLVENHCGVCRTPIEGGRLIELKASAPLGTCPNCKRLLIIEPE